MAENDCGRDLSDAVQKLAEGELRCKETIRSTSGLRPSVPRSVLVEPAENESAPEDKNPASGKYYPEAHSSDPKDSTKIGAQPATTLPRTLQDRMEQKILQIEHEQQARDAKLEELEEMNSRRAGPERHKVVPRPRSDEEESLDDESGLIDNAFLNPDPEAVRRAEEDGLAIAVAVEEEDEPNVYDVELKMYDPEAKPPFYKNRRFRCYSALICLLTSSAIIVAGVLSARRGSETILITQAPSAAPSQAPTTSRETAVRGELARVIGDLVNDPETAFEAALAWIIHDDPMELDEFSENLIQRYTLALFYFKTSEKGPWRSCNPPSEDEDYACEFHEMKRLEDNSVVYEPREELEVRWLSEKHECEWAEVLCHPEMDGNVIAIDICKLGCALWNSLGAEFFYLTIFFCSWFLLFCSGPESDRNYARRVEATGSADVVRTIHSCFVCTAKTCYFWFHLSYPGDFFLPSPNRLSLSFNYFTGTIPEVYGEFPYLTIFECTENLITGTYANVLVKRAFEFRCCFMVDLINGFAVGNYVAFPSIIPFDWLQARSQADSLASQIYYS